MELPIELNGSSDGEDAEDEDEGCGVEDEISDSDSVSES